MLFVSSVELTLPVFAISSCANTRKRSPEFFYQFCRLQYFSRTFLLLLGRWHISELNLVHHDDLIMAMLMRGQMPSLEKLGPAELPPKTISDPSTDKLTD